MKPRIFLQSRLIFVVDLFLIIVAALGSYALRLDLGPLFVFYLQQAYFLIGVSLIIKPVVFYMFGLYRRLWVYASIRELMIIFIAVTTASVAVSVVLVILRATGSLPNYPRGTLPIDYLLTLALIGGGIGIGLGVVGSYGIAYFAEWRTVIRADAIVVAVGFAGAVGIFFGLYPARKASRLDPIDALSR